MPATKKSSIIFELMNQHTDEDSDVNLSASSKVAAKEFVPCFSGLRLPLLQKHQATGAGEASLA